MDDYFILRGDNINLCLSDILQISDEQNKKKSQCSPSDKQYKVNKDHDFYRGMVKCENRSL